mmetsp:Transcript_47509/g.107698  ORF Transcript_47509/g.107698 Transcript_47509/m.107698 type:complete len:111 (-) Transcript_47509:149-481(-)
MRRLVVSDKMLTSFKFNASVAVCTVVAYFGLGLAFYMGYSSWRLTETVYFLTATMTTVGYGDVLPSKPRAGEVYVTCLFVVFGVVCVGAVFSEIAFQVHLVECTAASFFF